MEAKSSRCTAAVAIKHNSSFTLLMIAFAISSTFANTSSSCLRVETLNVAWVLVSSKFYMEKTTLKTDNLFVTAEFHLKISSLFNNTVEIICVRVNESSIYRKSTHSGRGLQSPYTVIFHGERSCLFDVRRWPVCYASTDDR